MRLNEMRASRSESFRRYNVRTAQSANTVHYPHSSKGNKIPMNGLENSYALFVGSQGSEAKPLDSLARRAIDASISVEWSVADVSKFHVNP